MNNTEALQSVWDTMPSAVRKEVKRHLSLHRHTDHWSIAIRAFNADQPIAEPVEDQYNFRKAMGDMLFFVLDVTCSMAATDNNKKAVGFNTAWHSQKFYRMGQLQYDNFKLRQKLFKKAMVLAEQTGEYDVMIKVAVYQQNTFSLDGIDQFEEWDAVLRKAQKLHEGKIEALRLKTLYYALLNDFDASGHKYDYEQSAAIIDKLNKLDAGKTKSPFTTYFRMSVYMDFLNRKGLVDDAEEVGRDLIRFVESNPAVNKPRRVSLIYSDIADNMLRAKRYDVASKYSNFAIESSPTKGHNVANICFAGFYAEFHQGKYDLAREWLARISRINLANFPFTYNRLRYYTAWLAHAEGDYVECNRILSSMSAFKEDQEGYHLCYRLLYIKNDFMRLDIDKMEKRIDSLRKHISKLRKGDGVKPRFYQISLMLRRWMQSDFAGNPFTELPEWEPFDEPIPVERWAVEVFVAA